MFYVFGCAVIVVLVYLHCRLLRSALANTDSVSFSMLCVLLIQW